MSLNVQSIGKTPYVSMGVRIKESKVNDPAIDLNMPKDTVDFSTNKSADNNAASKNNKVRKAAVGFSSIVVPGLGQLINGNTKSAIKHFGGAAGVNIATQVAATLLSPVNPIAASVVILGGSIATLGIGVHSAVDAYKKA